MRFIGKRSAMPPLGLLTVAAMLPPSWNLRLVDTNVVPLRDEDLEWADLAMVSAMNVQEPSARRILARCRSAAVTTVAGGPLFTSGHARFPEVDHLVLNEAEITLPRFLADFTAGRARRLYASHEFADVHRTPAPRWDLLNLSHYGCMGVQYSRGCPFNCEFCDVTLLFGHKPRLKRAEQILRELDGLRGAGWRGSVFFVDDNLIGNKRHLREELLPALIGWQQHNRGTTFNTQASINLADDPELLRRMADAGFDTVFIGIETPADDSLAECGKLQNRRRDLVADVKKIQRAGIQVQGGFIVGFDSDRPSVFQQQVDFIQKSGIVTAMVGMLQALPGTRLYDRLLGEGRIRGTGSGDNVDGTTNIVPAMGLPTLTDGYEALLRTIYSPRSYYQRVRTFLSEFSCPNISPRLDRNRLVAFCRSLLRIGVLGPERFQYWRLLGWTLFRRPRLFEVAVQLAIMGYHFRRICVGQLGC